MIHPETKGSDIYWGESRYFRREENLVVCGMNLCADVCVGVEIYEMDDFNTIWEVSHIILIIPHKMCDNYRSFKIKLTLLRDSCPFIVT